jgi:hypothetical protein
MNTTVINATEYRNLLLALTHRVHHQSPPYLRGCSLEGTGREHPHPRSSLTLACASLG